MKKLCKYLLPLLILALCLAACAEETATTSDREDSSEALSSQAQSLPEETSSEETSSEEPSTAESTPAESDPAVSEPTESGGGEELPQITPEELYTLYTQAESSSFVMEIEIPGERVATAMVYYQNGVYHIVSVMEAGTYTKRESYLQKDGDTAYMYSPDENGNWIGFDADMARLVAEKLGVECEFVVIDWDLKIMELDSKSIDVVWNGMTLTQGVLEAMNCTNAYCNNAQVIILPAAK